MDLKDASRNMRRILEYFEKYLSELKVILDGSSGTLIGFQGGI